jgi:hypothetical protein
LAILLPARSNGPFVPRGTFTNSDSLEPATCGKGSEGCMRNSCASLVGVIVPMMNWRSLGVDVAGLTSVAVKVSKTESESGSIGSLNLTTTLESVATRVAGACPTLGKRRKQASLFWFTTGSQTVLSVPWPAFSTPPGGKHHAVVHLGDLRPDREGDRGHLGEHARLLQHVADLGRQCCSSRSGRSGRS